MAEEKDLLTGRIIRGIGGFYYVKAEDGVLYECKAKGLFRKEGQKPLVGDLCKLIRVEESDPDAMPAGSIREILPRKSELLRPAVANPDQALILFAMHSPEPNFMLLDTFLLRMELSGLPVVIVVNKTDLDEDGSGQKLFTERFAHTDYPLLFISAKKEQGIEALQKILEGKCTVLAGPSGVGKSSLINLLQNKIVMETSRISQKTERGRHTTRRSELIETGPDTYIFDTPGFTSLGLQGIEASELAKGFREIARWEEGCRFAGCSHISEPV